METVHEPVLLHEVVKAFAGSHKIKAKGQEYLTYVDGTLGGAGHALAICESLPCKIRIIGLDRDPRAIERAKNALNGKAQEIILENTDFRNMDTVLDKHGVTCVDLILLDLGVSSDELTDSGKGFSFLHDEPLYMTMGDPDKAPFTAKSIINDWDEEDIANVIYAYGEERYARRIAGAIVRYRTKKPIETSGELAEIVKNSVPPPYRRGKIHPATKTFQALRIAVNDELAALKEGLTKGFDKLCPGGLMAVISFHSLEDRIVKNFFKDFEKKGAIIQTKKPIRADLQEVAENPRSRSAKMRIIQK